MAPPDLPSRRWSGMTAILRGGDISGHLSDVVKTYRRWFGSDYDIGALKCVLCAAAAEKLGGDPPWLLVVGGSGVAKTETITPLVGAGAVAVSTINGEAALLSGTSKKDRAKEATGGLLPKIGNHGLLVIKDVTSILSMNRDTRALVLAALREIYDGHWNRNVGTDGGQTLSWSGRIVIIGAVTSAWDAAHAVVSVMGDRFLLVRISSAEHRQAASRQAMRNVNHEADMRVDLANKVSTLFKAVNPEAEITLTEHETEKLFEVADVVTRGRTAIERDFQGNPLYAHALEMPTRFAKQLVQIIRGGIALGMDRDAALAAAMRCASDSLPPLRQRILHAVSSHPKSPICAVVKLVQLPRKTVDRTLQELLLLGLLTFDEQPWGEQTRYVYTVKNDKVIRSALAALAAEKSARNVRGGPTMSR
jgi:hypothetical protein